MVNKVREKSAGVHCAEVDFLDAMNDLEKTSDYFFEGYVEAMFNNWKQQWEGSSRTPKEHKDEQIQNKE